MMANLLKIKEIAKEKKVSIRDLSASAGITEQGLQRLIRENSTKVDTLEAIAKKLNVPISVFFDETPSIDCKQTTEERLLSIIESQQRTIESLTSK